MEQGARGRFVAKFERKIGNRSNEPRCNDSLMMEAPGWELKLKFMDGLQETMGLYYLFKDRAKVAI